MTVITGILQAIAFALLAYFICRKKGRIRLRPLKDSSNRSNRASPGNCGRIPGRAYQRPDPLIYSQTWLKSQGMAVTWNNPDIVIEKNGVPQDSHALDPSTDYEIVARVWNGSTEAAAIDMPVRAHFRDFGIGGQRVDVGETRIDLPVNGAPGHPAFARIPWKTPAAPGHFCLKVELLWPDDANPANNVGQENTDVKPLNSPKAKFEIAVRNDERRGRSLRLEVNDYVPPRPIDCRERKEAPVPKMSATEVRLHTEDALARHGNRHFAVPDDWTVTLEPETLDLGPGEEVTVTVDVTAPDGFTGEKTFNVDALHGNTLFDGVTLTVHS